MNVVCPSCQAVNRVAPEKLSKSRPVCGKCKSELVPEASGFVIEVGDHDFESQVQSSQYPVLIDFWGPSCPPCRRLEPELVKLAKEMAGKVKVVKVNVEQNRRLPDRFGIRAVPTLILFQGSEIARSSGFQPLAGLRDFVSQVAKV